MGKVREAIEQLGDQFIQEQNLIASGINQMRGEIVQDVPEGIPQEMARSNAKINVGNQDGVSVKTDPMNHVYVVEVPNNYQVFWKLAGKKQGSDLPYATKLPFAIIKTESGEIKEDKSKVRFAVDINDLKSDKQIIDFNFKIRDSRFKNREIKTEFSRMIEKHQNAFKETVTVQSVPKEHYCNGTVLEVGKHGVLISSGENKEKKFLRHISATRLLIAEQFKDSEKALSEMCPIGSEKHFVFANNKISVSPYIPKVEKVAGIAKEITEVKSEVKVTETPKITKIEEVKKPIKTIENSGRRN